MYKELKEAWAELTAPGQMFEIAEIDIRGVTNRTYANAPGTLKDVWAMAAGHGDKEYLVYKDERCTYAQSQAYVASIANWLASQGVKPGDRVAIAMRNYPEWMLAYWAITSMGAVVVGMNAWWVPHEMHYGLEDSAPKVMICDVERLQRFEEIRADFPDLIGTAVRLENEAPEGVIDWVEVINSPAEMPAADIDPDDDACVFYTSGTTGRPKGAQLTHRGCVNNVMNLVFANMVQPLALAKASGSTDAPAGEAPAVSALVATPLFHVTANNCVAQTATIAGGKLVHMYKWDATEALKLIEQEQITTFSAVPMMAREVMMHPDFESTDTSSLKMLGGGGAAMQPDLVEKVGQKMANAQPGTGYGMTETCGVISSVSSAFFQDKPTSCGPPVPTLEAKCVNEAGETLPPGEIGELWVKGSNVIKGYINRPEATAESITDGWLHTGDVAFIDEEGFIFLVDRAKDMVLRGGENVYCAEVENALFSYDGVAECVAFAVPDDRLGEEVGAAIYVAPGDTVDVEALRGHCKGLLAPYKVPRYVWLLNEPLPRNANGKFLKRELRDSLAVEDAA